MRILLFLVLLSFPALSQPNDYIKQLIAKLHMDVIAPKMMKSYIESAKSQTNDRALPCLDKLANNSAAINEITYSVYDELFGPNGAKELVEYLNSDIGKNLELLTFKKITLEQFNHRMSPEHRQTMNQINAKYFNAENQRKQKELFRAKGSDLIRSILQECSKR